MAKNDGRTGWQAVKAGLELADCLFEGQIHIHICIWYTLAEESFIEKEIL